MHIKDNLNQFDLTLKLFFLIDIEGEKKEQKELNTSQMVYVTFFFFSFLLNSRSENEMISCFFEYMDLHMYRCIRGFLQKHNIEIE